jgi:serine/threonine protein kinase
VLGSGQFGKVFLGYNSSKPEIKVAIKTLSKKELDVNKIKSEIQILS